MMNGTIEHVVKNSILCSYVLAQPFGVYVDAYPTLQNEILLESEQLQFNQHGESVRLLQQKLHKLSFFDEKIDGEFGILTVQALEDFQANYQIPVNGEADMTTLSAIIKVEKEKYMKQIEQLSDSIYSGMRSEDVKIAQEALNYFGYYEGEIDGIYGPLTENALKMAEEEHGIKLTQGITEEASATVYEKEKNEEVEVEEEKEEEETINTEEKPAINNTAAEKKEQTKSEEKKLEVKANNTDVIQVANSFIGTPYVWGGESPGGFDCSGFIQFVYQEEDITIPRTVSEIWNFSQPVDAPSVGDLVFFSTYKPGPSHMGIYLGDGKFIHAGESRGVEISEMSNPYWEPKYLGAKRIRN